MEESRSRGHHSFTNGKDTAELFILSLRYCATLICPTGMGKLWYRPTALKLAAKIGYLAGRLGLESYQ